MASNFTEWSIQLMDGRLNRPISDSAGVVNVLTAGGPSEVTIYSDSSGTSASNPGTLSNGIFRFWTQSSVTSVDLSVLTSNGHAFFLEDITPSNHRVVVWPENSGLYNLIIPYQVVGASEAIVDTGFDILGNMLIKDCFVHVTTLGTGATLTVGTSTASTGFANGFSAASTGYPVTLLEEANVSTSSLLGSLLANGTGTFARKLHRRANSTSGANIVYTNTTSSSTAGEGYIYLTYQRIPT